MAREFIPPTEDQPTAGIDILTLFREDLDVSDRIELFKNAAEQLEQDIEALVTPDNVQKINNNYDLSLILNMHGDSTHAAQSLMLVENPFVTFIEAAGAKDIHQEPLFANSVSNAFNVRFNSQPAAKPPYPMPTYPNPDFGYWEERGLLAKGSIIVPIDVRSYSWRLLSALIDADYSADYLNQGVRESDFLYTPFEELLKNEFNRGSLIMYSNAVRELTSTKQIVETLLSLKDYEKLKSLRDKDIADKITAIDQRAVRDNSKLNAYILYGTAHHSIKREFSKRGIEIERKFARNNSQPSPFKFIGNSMQQFFNGRHFKTDDQTLEDYAKASILESFLALPLRNIEKYGLVVEDNMSETTREVWFKISKIARNKDLQDKLPTLIEEFKNDMWLPGRILHENGIYLHFLDNNI